MNILDTITNFVYTNHIVGWAVGILALCFVVAVLSHRIGK